MSILLVLKKGQIIIPELVAVIELLLDEKEFLFDLNRAQNEMCCLLLSALLSKDDWSQVLPSVI